MSETDLAKQLESVLFSAGRKVELEELSKICKSAPDDIKKAAKILGEKYSIEGSSIMLVEEGTGYKLTIREQYQNLVKSIVTETELPRTIIETLAVIAWKAPVLQNKVISIRTNKAYDHLKFLEEAGYISRQKHGRTRMIKLATKFFDYFDLPKEKVTDTFSKFTDIEKVITEKEREAKEIKKQLEEQSKEKNEEEKLKIEKGVKEIFQNASSEMPEVQKSNEVPAKEK